MTLTNGATLQDMLHNAAKFYPTNEAVVDGACRYTYRELLKKVRHTASLYYSLGVRKGDRVALLLYPSANHCVALFAAWELGAIPVGLHVRESATVLLAILNRLSPRTIVYDVNLYETINEIRSKVPTITGFVRARSDRTDPNLLTSNNDPLIPDDLGSAEVDYEPWPINENDVAIIALSSGTTGTPKGIVHTHRTLIQSARGGQYKWASRPNDVIVNSLSTSFIGWFNISLPFFNVGAKNVFISQFTPAAFLQSMQDEGVTTALLIPTMWRMILKEDMSHYDLSKVRLVAFAGEKMDQTTLTHIQEKITPHIINIYGSTETGSGSGGTIMFEWDMKLDGKLTSVGKPLLNSTVRVIKQGGTADDEVEPGEYGEVIISGHSVASEVWGDPKTTRRIFEGPWWHSGDIGRLDEDGYLFLEGRIDDMIISGGINILPARVEEEMLKHPSVSEVAVIGLPDDVWGQQVAAFVVSNNTNLTTDELDGFLLKSELSHYQRPRSYAIVDTLPKTTTGKLNRRLLREQIVNRLADASQ